MDSRVATVDMDDATLAAEGRYQDWTRDKYSSIIRWVDELGGKLLGFDVYFMERSSRLLKYEDIQALQDPRNVPQVEAATGYVKGMGTLTYGNQSIENASFNGVMADYVRVENVSVEEGRFFTEQEERSLARVVVLGSEVKEDLFGESLAIGESIKIQRESFRVVGILTPRGTSGFSNQDEQVYVPLPTAQKILLGIKHVNMARLKMRDENYVEQTMEDVRATLRVQHRIRNPEDDDFTVRSQAQALDVLTGVTDALSFFLAVIAAISLLVGGIGIMNIMYVVVTERTREIGLRKAVGAKQQQVLFQFLMEAVVLAGMGGLLGVMVGVSISGTIAWVVNYLGFEWAFVVSPTSIVSAFIVTSVIGVVFGYYPARRAAHLDPIEALRYE